ncbi:MAG: PhoX family phosphatase [Roseobacter sp.]
MKDVDQHKMSADEWDEVNFPRPERNDFDDVVERALSRRGFLGGVLAFGSGAAVMGAGMLKGSSALAQPASRFPFTPIAAQTDNTIHVPEGYGWKTLVRWGDPLFSDAEGAFDPEAGVSLEMSERVFGENTDGMELFNIDGREVIVVNSEYVNPDLNLAHTDDGMPTSVEDVRLLQNFQGVSVMEVAEGAEGWAVVIDSPYNRRIHHNTPMTFSGPAAGHELLKTDADPTGMESLGTFNNCGSGRTPWDTYLTCEENFNGYFGATAEVSADDTVLDGFRRYGVSTAVDAGRYNYHGFDARFDVATNPNEPHRAGYIVEIDPANPDSTPIKHTALGRFKHENAACAIAADGRVAVYMGDDARGEFMYRWLSRDAYVPGGDTSTLLVEGELSVAVFDEDMSGRWLPLTPATTGMDMASISIFTRMAASAVGATTMDRPEWIAVHPNAAEAYCCLTNNSRRGVLNDDGTVRTNAGGDPMTVNAVNPRDTNRYGQIVRWRPAGGDHGAAEFAWDLYVMAGNPTVAEGLNTGSANINEGNLFNSPDGMVIDQTGLIWIQTDGNDSNEGDFAGMGNNQMLAGDPVTGLIERFMTGPRGCEVTGLCWSSDRRTMFVGIQHPGDDGGDWPDHGGSLARSSVIAIKRDDGGLVG